MKNDENTYLGNGNYALPIADEAVYASKPLEVILNLLLLQKMNF